MRRAALLVALLLVGGACGNKNAPLAPELVQPLPPTQLTASIEPEGVRLTWRRPTQTSGGRRLDDLGRFLVDRAAGDGAVWQTIATVVVEDRDRFRRAATFEWLDRAVDPGTRWSYRVVAVTLDDYHSPAAGPVTVDVPQPGAPTPPPVVETPKPSMRVPGRRGQRRATPGGAAAPTTTAPGTGTPTTAPPTTVPPAGDTPGANTPGPR